MQINNRVWHIHWEGKKQPIETVPESSDVGLSGQIFYINYFNYIKETRETMPKNTKV